MKKPVSGFLGLIIHISMIIAIAISLMVIRQVEAHAGGTPQIVNQTAGDFVISVWSLPDPLLSNTEVNFITYLSDGNVLDLSRAAEPVLGATIELTFSQGGREVRFDSTHGEATNKLFYESYLVIPDGGTWTVTVQAEHEGKSGVAQFEIEVLEPEREINWLLYGGIGLVIIAIGWFVWQSRQEDENENENEESQEREER